MRQARRPLVALLALAAVIGLLVAPAAALAADPATVTGTVVRDGAPVVGVEVVVTVTGTDVIASTATDEQGAFSLEVEAGVGDELQVFATGQTSRTDPDNEGCVRSETPIGDTTTTIEALPPDPIEVDLDTVLTSTVCTATGTPRVTPPSTEALGAGRTPGTPAGGLLLTLGALALVGGGALALGRRRA